MKIILLLLLFFPLLLPAQNLVPNGSFETFTNCPDNYSQFALATGWEYCSGNHPTTDYCNACGTNGFSVPNNVWGTQSAADGVAYMALATTATNYGANYRENIYTKLQTSLKPGKKYLASFQVSKSGICMYASNRMGLKFAVDSFFQQNNFSQISQVSVISDTTGWTTVSGTFIADSAYKYIAVGNFYDDANTTISVVCPGCSMSESEYYLDNIIVRTTIIGPDKVICKGDTAHLSATGGDSYAWSPASGLNCTNCSNPVANPSITTTYVVTTTIDNSVLLDTEIIKVLSPIINISRDTAICSGHSAQLSSSSGFTSYSWSPATGLSCTSCPNPVASPTLATIYKLVADSAGCISTDSTIIKVDAQPAITAGPGVTICSGQSTKLSSSGNGIYIWSPSTGLNNPDIPTPTASPTITTAYVISNINSCGTATDTTLVFVKPSPVINHLTSDTSICPGKSVQLKVDTLPDYSWSPAIGLSCDTCSKPLASPTVSTTYQLTSFFAGCASVDSVVITVLPLPVVDAGLDTNFCKGHFVQLSASGNGNFLWSPSTGLSNTTIANPIANPGETTTYTVTNTVCGIATDTVVVTVLSYPVISFVSPDVSICKGSLTILLVSTYNNYSWTPRTGLDCYVCQLTHAGPDTTTKYYVTLNNKGCKATDSVTVTVFDPKLFSAGRDTLICQGHSAKLNASSTTSYLWMPGTSLNNDTIANPIATPLVTTTYTVVGTDSICGPQTKTVVVTIQIKPHLQISADTSICTGGSTSLNVSGGTTYQWSPQNSLNDFSSANPSASPPSSTTYTVTAYNLPDCFSSAQVSVSVIPLPEIELTPQVDIVCGLAIQLTPSVVNASEFHWKAATGLSDSTVLNPEVNPKVDTRYTLVASDSGCEVSASVQVNILQGYINLPTAFSPNGNGHDDIYRLIYSCEFTLDYFRIYNRWGEMVFETNDPATGWDGKYKGNDSQVGVYVYIVAGHRDNGEKISMNGNVTLLR